MRVRDTAIVISVTDVSVETNVAAAVIVISVVAAAVVVVR